MPFRRLFIIVEGGSDDDFVDVVLRPLVERVGVFNYVDIVHWAQKSDNQRRGLIHSIVAMGGDYIFLHDLDEGCKEHRREVLLREHPYLDPDNIALACYEIESWYCAGAPGEFLLMLGFREDEIERIRKEQFSKHCKDRRRDPLLTKLELLEVFDVDTAKLRSPSFRRLAQKQLRVP